MIVLIKLILVHLVGDFILQPGSWVRQKQAKKLVSSKLYLHILLHFILSWTVFWDLSKWPVALAIAVSHFIIDVTKLYLQRDRFKRLLFFLDQLAHIIVLITICYLFFDLSFKIHFNDEFWYILTGALFVTQPSSIIIKTLIGAYKPQTGITSDESLTNAGNYIGILERILIFLFILFDHWEGVGFLIAAKSIFRFSDLSQAKDRKLTEYILIGTLLSFGIAISVGLFCSLLVNFA